MFPLTNLPLEDLALRPNLLARSLIDSLRVAGCCRQPEARRGRGATASSSVRQISPLSCKRSIPSTLSLMSFFCMMSNALPCNV